MRIQHANRGVLAAALVAGATILGAAPAGAQIRGTANEEQVDRLNSQMGRDQQFRGATEQRQFENNQVRTQIQTAPSAPSAPPPPIVVPVR